MKFSIDNIHISNSLKYRAMFACGGIIHTCFLILFFMIGVEEMGIVNIFSVTLYILGSLFSVSNRTGHMRYGWMIAFFSEIIVHTILCMIIVGMEADFYLFLLVILPISTYVLFFSCDIKVFLRTITVFIIISLLAGSITVMAVSSSDNFPICPLDYSDISIFRMINMISAAIMLIGFSLLFVLEVHALIKDLGSSNQQLEYTATHDALTGLYNRHSLKPLFEELSGSRNNFCIALGDIDNFKKVNDTYGHDGGDAVLKKLTALIADGIDENDVACRWGGEEILVILRGTRFECLEKITRIHKNIRACSVESNGTMINATMTFGFVEKHADKNIEELISIADKRLYKGKTSGKNVIVTE